MSESTAGVTGVTSQYATKVAEDLEHNLKEQQRISVDIAALQEQLTALQEDHVVLTSLQGALGIAPVPTAAEPVTEPAAVVPAPRKRTEKAAAKPKAKETAATKSAKATKPKDTVAAKARVTTPAKAKDAAPAKAKETAPTKSTRKPAAKKSPAAPAAGQPTLVTLIREHLAAQKEPRSAAEVTSTLTEQHPDRSIKTTVVRTTLEGLVARSQARRSKQGSSVYYTSPDASDATPAEEAKPSA
ncbi:hypothetical protein ACIQAC_25520 [Streptomyces sp. NPDC088387]|uniref:hypothetical protein n=1 Tax=Streptomyces sp. NPDC088387 TaxID=3365859 RepID=UPI00382DF077